jgi:hypothetical protein
MGNLEIISYSPREAGVRQTHRRETGRPWRENVERGPGGYGMRIFLDTADNEEIREVARWGILSGVTTNPTLMMKSGGKSHEAVIREIAEIVDDLISAETVSLDTAGMVNEGERFARWHTNVVVKVPSKPDGWAAVKQLKQEGIGTNVTLCFSANQALFAALVHAGIIIARNAGIKVADPSLRAMLVEAVASSTGGPDAQESASA